MYNLAVSEIIQNINAEGSFYAGAKWQGVWTRDSSYAIDLGLSFLFPQNVETTLKSCVLNGQIKQDTGTGGGYPISSDRVVWGLAAFSYAKMINSIDVYQYVYDILSKSIEKFGPKDGSSNFLKKL